MAWPCTSFNTTIGILVTGSIIRPRIFISTSIEASPKLRHVLAHQTIGTRTGRANLHVGSQKRAFLGSEIYNPVTCGVPTPLIFAARFVADEQFERVTNQGGIAPALISALHVLQDRKTTALILFGNRVRHGKRRRIGPRRILEGKQAVVANSFEETQRLCKIVFGLAGKADDDVRGDGDFAFSAAQHGRS